MSNWYDDIMPAVIQAMMGNHEPLKYTPLLTRKLLKKAVQTNDVEWLMPEGEWHYRNSTEALNEGTTYRLRLNWKQPKPEPEWIECEVILDESGGYWKYRDLQGKYHFCCLVDAPGQAGFGGVLYEKLGGWYTVFQFDCDGIPYTPLKVRFHRPTLVKLGLIESEVDDE